MVPVVLVKVPLILPEPLLAIPVTNTVLSLDQLNIVPAVLLESRMGEIGPAEQVL